jgi:hypothetical protein
MAGSIHKLQISLLVSSIEKFAPNNPWEADTPNATSLSREISNEHGRFDISMQIHAIQKEGTGLANQHCDGIVVFLVDKDCIMHI